MGISLFLGGSKRLPRWFGALTVFRSIQPCRMVKNCPKKVPQSARLSALFGQCPNGGGVNELESSLSLLGIIIIDHWPTFPPGCQFWPWPCLHHLPWGSTIFFMIFPIFQDHRHHNHLQGGVEATRGLCVGGGVLLHARHHRHRLWVLHRWVPRHWHRWHVARATEAQGMAVLVLKNIVTLWLCDSVTILTI